VKRTVFFERDFTTHLQFNTMLRHSYTMKARTFVILAVLFSGLLAFGGSETGLKITKTSAKEFNIRREVVQFYESVLRRNPKVAAKQQELIEASSGHGGGSVHLGDPVAIEWLVPNFINDFGGTDTRNAEYVYLVQQQLQAGFHHGYSVDGNLVAQIRVKLHAQYEQNPQKKEEDFILVSNSLTLSFEGFVKMTLHK